METCSVKMCGDVCHAKGLCSKHYDAQRRKDNPEKCRKQYREWAINHIDEERERKKQWNRDNVARCHENDHRWEKENRGRRRVYKKEKYRRDPNYRMACCIRSRTYKKIGQELGGSNVSAIRDLGCTMAELVKHLELQWLPSMSWSNHGNDSGDWSIDHIRPFASFDLTDPEQVKQVVHYTNLRPMWHIDNIKKGAKI